MQLVSANVIDDLRSLSDSFSSNEKFRVITKNNDQISGFQSGDPVIEKILAERGYSVVGQRDGKGMYNPVEKKPFSLTVGLYASNIKDNAYTRVVLNPKYKNKYLTLNIISVKKCKATKLLCCKQSLFKDISVPLKLFCT